MDGFSWESTLKTMEKIEFLGYSNCYRLSNAEAELVIPTDFGPRVLAYGPPSGTKRDGRLHG